MIKVAFLGTNGWYDTKTGNTLCVLVETDSEYVVFDAGNGFYKLDRYIKTQKPIHVFLSHFHIDHIVGLHTLVKFRFQKGLKIFGQVGTAAILNTFVAEPFTVPLTRLPYPVSIMELEEGEHAIPFTVECLPLVHPAPCYGYRLTLDGRVVTYCIDTGICDNAVTLARDADLLITECGLKPGQESPGWPHLNPENAIDIAQKAHAKRLALMHFGAEVYRTLDDRCAVQKQFEKAFPGLVVATDDLTIDM